MFSKVLQYGFSGCGGGDHWTLTSFYVNDAGRAYCGRMFRVDVGDKLVGNMTLVGPDTWAVISVDETNGQRSEYSAKVHVGIHFASITMELIRAYSCGAYPATGPITFSNNMLLAADADGGDASEIPAVWNTTVKYTECGQGVEYSKGRTLTDDVTVTYNTSNVRFGV